MTFWEIVKPHERLIPAFVEMYNKKLVIPRRESFDVGIDIYARWDIAELPETVALMRSVSDGCVAEKMDTYITIQTLGGGPKIFRPTSEQLFALEGMKLNIEVADFNMPYPTIIVEFPEEYQLSRCPEAHCSILHLHDTTKLFIHSLVYGRTALKLWWPGRPQDDVEEWFTDPNVNYDMGNIPTEVGEHEREQIVRRAVLNYCLLLDEVGVRCQGPQTPNQYNKLVKWCQKNNKHTTRNKAELQAQPKVYGLDKKPTPLIRIVGDASQLPAAETGRKVSPHSRRGHYRMQVHGPGNSLRKRIRIPLTIVNKDMLLGGPPSAEYKT